MTMKNDEEFWKDTHTLNQAFRKIIHKSKDYKEFNKDTQKDAKYILDKLKLQDEDVVLELGCGLGRLLMPLSKHCKEIIGLDISGNMISLAEAFIEEHADKSLGKITLGTMPNSYTILLADNSIDKAYSFIVLQHMNKYLAMANIMAIKKALKYGGTALFQFPNLEYQTAEFFNHVNYWTHITIPTARMYYYTKRELEIYFEHMKFSNVEIWEEGKDLWVRCDK